MERNLILIDSIPTVVWGKESEKIYIYVHGKNGNKEEALFFADITERKGYQTISFDLPSHGERKNKDIECNIWNGIHDLECIWKYVQRNWDKIYLYACSIGAYFSLHAYKNRNIEKCLFLSPILDMDYLIHNMFSWFDVSENELKERQKIETPIETLSWKYYQYVKENPVQHWDIPTAIMYGSKDILQSIEIVRHFSMKFNCQLYISKESEHSFMSDSDRKIVTDWIEKSI